MILDHYRSPNRPNISYLVACPKTRQAALINPLVECMSAYEATLANRNLHLVRVFLTDTSDESFATAERLGAGRNALEVFPAATTVSGSGEIENSPYLRPITHSGECSADLGSIRIEVLRDTTGGKGTLMYRTADYTFTSESLLIGDPERFAIATDDGPAVALQLSPQSAHRQTVYNFRKTREGVSIEELLLEDLHTSLIENAFSPKETLVVRAYIELLEENELNHPSAAELGAKIGNIDRSVIHVLVHSIRWKQIELDRLPLVLAGQASKWLRSLKREPEFTSHEEEFLAAYLRLVESRGTPPSGPDIAVELGGERSIQWVRKRAFTIRRKQREFNQPLLILARNKPELSHVPHPVSVIPKRNLYVFNQLPTV